jgi:hypothetical protein
MSARSSFNKGGSFIGVHESVAPVLDPRCRRCA